VVTGKRGQFCREVLIDAIRIDPSRVLKTPPWDDTGNNEQCFHNARGVSLHDDIDPHFAWDDNRVGVDNEDHKWPLTAAHCSAAWVVHANTLPCFFSNAESFFRESEDLKIESNPCGAAAHCVITRRHAAGAHSCSPGRRVGTAPNLNFCPPRRGH
jgi:hypothetical protein